MNWVRGTSYSAPLALMLGALLGTSAYAQVAKAPGIKIGEGRLHPFIELDGRYDSVAGYFQLDENSSVITASPEVILHGRGGLRFELDTPSTLVKFNGSGEGLWYTGLLTKGLSTSLSRAQANVALDTRFNRDGAVEVQLGDSMTRSDRTQNPLSGIGLLSLFNNVYLAAPIHPGGRALEVTPRVGWTVEFFEAISPVLPPGCVEGTSTCDPKMVFLMNYNNVAFGLNARWKFLPKTAIVLDANLDWRTYFAGAGSTNPLSTVLRVQGGLAGLISPRISVTLLAGYSGDLANNLIHTVIGTAEFAYTVSELTRLVIGYMRNAVPVPSAGTMLDDKAYLRGGIGFAGGRLVFNAMVAADYLTFFSPTRRNDFVVSGTVGPTFSVNSIFDIGAAYTLSYRTSSVAALSTVNFLRHEALLRLTFHY